MDLRNNSWLESKMYYLWENFFCDVPRKNKVLIRFGRKAKRRLGSIRVVKKASMLDRLRNREDDTSVTEIRITGHFRDPLIPEYVVLATIAHEMIHYAHGFQSPLDQRFRHPHRGSLIKKEMQERGLGDLWLKSEKWIKGSWLKFLGDE